MPGSQHNLRAVESRTGLTVFCPSRFCHQGVTEISPKLLKEAGFEAVLLDLDNTLVGWQRSDVSAAVEAWIAEIRALGMKMFLVSNTRHGQRLIALSERFDIPYVKRAWKPRATGFLTAMQELGVRPDKTVMIGDQMFTDVLGGNRLGITTIMVKPMNSHEFFGTKISRAAEKVLLGYFRKKGLIG